MRSDLATIVLGIVSEQKLLLGDGEVRKLDSLEIIDLIVALEAAINFRIPSASIRADVFVSIEAICHWLAELGDR